MSFKGLVIGAGVGGLAMALVSNIPVLNFVNCLLCIGLWGGGVLAVWIYRISAGPQADLSIGQGIVVGLLAGVVGAVIGSVISAVFSLLFGSLNTLSMLESIQDVPGASDTLAQMTGGLALTGASSVIGMIFSLICNLFVYPFFGAIGGVLATALIWKKA